jgi:hypothetical protein
MDPDSIGAVRRTLDSDGVTLHVRGSRNALIGLILIGILPLAAIVTFGVLATRFAVLIFGGGGGGGGGATAAIVLIYMLGMVFAVTAVICAVTFNPLRRLLRTATRRTTFTLDPTELRVHAVGYFRDTILAWPVAAILDVVVRYRQSGVYELHVVPADRPPTVLLYGASEAELEFLASELRRAIGVDRLLRAAAGAWGDQVDEGDGDVVDLAPVTPAQPAAPVAPATPVSPAMPASSGMPAMVLSDASSPAAPQPMLQYAPESNEDVIRHRGAGSVRLLVPPLAPSQVLRNNRWFAVLFAILVVAAAEPYVFGWLRRVVTPMMILIVPTAGFCAGMIGWHMLKCLRHTAIDATSDDLMLAVRWPIIGRVTTRWPVDAVRGIRAVGDKPPRVEFCLRSGRRQTLAYLPTFQEAAELAAQLQRAQIPPLPGETLRTAVPVVPPPPAEPPTATATVPPTAAVAITSNTAQTPPPPSAAPEPAAPSPAPNSALSA